MPNINKIKLSGTSYDIQDANATKTVELTQAQYDALVTGGTVDSNTFYVITDGEMFNPSGKVDTSAFTEFSGAVETELSGKTDESAFTAHTGDSTIHVTTAQTAAWNAKSDFSGSYNDLTDKPTIPTVPTSNTAFTNDAGYITSNDITGKTDTTAFTAHTADTTIHVTAQDKTNWNAKSNFSGSYNDLTDKPTIPTVPTSNTAFTNDAGYITSNDITGKTDTTAFTAHTADTTIHVTTAQTAAWNAKSDFSGSYNDLTNKLSAGTNISIVDNVISAEGGSSVNVVQTTGTSTTDVMSQNAVTTQLNNKANKSAAVGGYQFGSSSDGDYIQYRSVNNSNIGNSIYYPKINGKAILTSNNIYARNNYDFQLVKTSAITTAITSSSTDSQVPSAKAVYDAIQEGGGGGGGITSGEVQTMIDESVSGKANSSDSTYSVSTNIQNDGIYFTTLNKDGNQIYYSFEPQIRFQAPLYSDYNDGKVKISGVTAVTSASTDSEIPTAKAVNDKLGGLSLVKLTQAEYDALATKDSNTLYVING